MRRLLAALILSLAGCADDGCAGGEPIRVAPNSNVVIYTMRGIIYIAPEFWNAFTGPAVSANNAARLAHEQIHLHRQRVMGCDTFAKLYRDNTEFRWQEEKLAYETEALYRSSHGEPMSASELENDVLSSPYRQMVDRDTAHEWAVSLTGG